MRVLVVGGGGREHAIVEALRRSRADIYAAMANQNPGIRRASKDVLLGDVTAVDLGLAIKALGLAVGKGVRVWGDHFTTKAEALAYGKEILTKQIGGVPRFLVEEKLVGEEFSLQALCDGQALVPSPLAQDHKRAYEGDKGPNTGGMGSYSDADHRLPFVTPQDFEGALETMRKTVAAMAARGTPFKGILYGGFMATKDGPKLLEFNVRFADPESMNVLPILEDDFLETCH